MKSIIITGSTRGIGFGLADEFLKRGCQVTVNGRSQTSIDSALQNSGLPIRLIFWPGKRVM